MSAGYDQISAQRCAVEKGKKEEKQWSTDAALKDRQRLRDLQIDQIRHSISNVLYISGYLRRSLALLL